MEESQNINEYKIHIVSGDNHNLTLIEISDVIDLINKAYNDYLRENSVSNSNLKNYSLELTSVENGSLKLNFTDKFKKLMGLGKKYFFNFSLMKRSNDFNQKNKNKKIEINGGESNINNGVQNINIAIYYNAGCKFDDNTQDKYISK